jgi:hypothetical protein
MSLRIRLIPAASPKPLSIMSTPADAKAWAIPSPMPLVDPVMIAALPTSSPRAALAGALAQVHGKRRYTASVDIMCNSNILAGGFARRRPLEDIV